MTDWIVRENPETGEIWLENTQTGEEACRVRLEGIIVSTLHKND